MLKLLPIIVTISILLYLGACMSYPTIVEAKDVRFFEIKEYQAIGGRSVKLKGLVFHSALAVSGIDVIPAGDTVQVLVRLTPAKKGLSGSFQVDVPLPSPNSRILFGPSNVQIWPLLP